jgi:hypothetical protein
MTDTDQQLLDLLNGPYSELRDDTHIAPNEILVYDVAAGTIEAVDLMELPLRYPCGAGNRWSYEDLGHVVADKALLYRQSIIAHEISEEDEEAEPTCGTVVLVITTDHRPYQRIQTRARITPEKQP